MSVIYKSQEEYLAGFSLQKNDDVTVFRDLEYCLRFVFSIWNRIKNSDIHGNFYDLMLKL